MFQAELGASISDSPSPRTGIIDGPSVYAMRTGLDRLASLPNHWSIFIFFLSDV